MDNHPKTPTPIHENPTFHGQPPQNTHTHPRKPRISWTTLTQTKQREPSGLARAAWFERLAGVFASRVGTPYYNPIHLIPTSSHQSTTEGNNSFKTFSSILNTLRSMSLEALYS